MDRIRLLVEISKFFERQLERHGANGKGLHEKATSIEPILPGDLIKKLHRIAAIRNKEIHSDGADFDESSLLREALHISLNWNKDVKQKVEDKNLNETYEKKVELAQLPIKNLSDNEVKELIYTKYPDLTDDALEDLIDNANSHALAVYYPAYERWDSFIYLAKRKSYDDTEKLYNLTLSAYAGGDILETVKLIKVLIPMSFLRREYDSCCKSSVGPISKA